MNKWYIAAGPQGDVAVSTRVRLARNLKDLPFPSRMNVEQRHTVEKKVFAALKNSEIASDFEFIELHDLSDAQAVSMAEKHLISPEFAANRQTASLLLTHNEETSIMLCEEDHIRLQVMKPGMQLEEAFAGADKIDDILDAHLNLAFDENLGFLTQCPTNLGTGMRASVMLHLPALRMCSQISRLTGMVQKLGLTLRGTYGENSKANGDFYQLSNQVTLGISEKAALDNLAAITMQIIARERDAREELSKNDDFEDKLWRAWGTLRYARKLSSKEFMELISCARLGVALGWFPVSYETIGELTAKMQPATLMTHADATLDAQLRDQLRAKLVRETLDATKNA